MYRTIFILIFSSTFTFGQLNLIPNGNLEDYHKCPFARAQFDGFIKEWSQRINYPEYRNCGFIDPDGTIAHSGSAYFIVEEFLDIRNAREYAQVKLKMPLEITKNYFIKYYAKSPGIIKNLRRGYGIRFVNNHIFKTIDSFFVAPHFVDTNTIISSSKWHEISGCFKVDSSYDILVVGNFFSPEKMLWVNNIPGDYSATMYDNFQLYEIPETLELDFASRKICVGDCITLRSNMSNIGTQFFWNINGPENYTSTDSVFKICFSKPGKYSVSKEVEYCNGFIKNEWNSIIVVEEAPQLLSSRFMEIKVLEGETLELSSCYLASEYKWISNLLGNCSDCSQLKLLPIFSSDTILCIANPNSSCSDTCIFFIKVLKKPIADFSSNTNEICSGSCFLIINESKNSQSSFSYSLSGPKNYSGNSNQKLEFCLDIPGTYYFNAIVNNDIIYDSLDSPIEIKVFSVPNQTTHSHEDLKIKYGDSIVLIACTNAANYSWKSDFINCQQCINPLWKGNKSEKVKLISYNESIKCSIECEYNIELIFNQANIWIPNIFSPNQDGVNDILELIGDNIKPILLEVYDRWGSKVYQNNTLFSWNGTHQEKQVNPGVYIVSFTYIDLSTNTTQRLVQDITLVR